MGNLSTIGRIFYGIAVLETGLQTLYYGDFPYWLVPPRHAWLPGIAFIAYASGLLLMVAGACIVFQKKTRLASLLLGAILLLVFIFGFIPFVVLTTPDIRWLVWHNAEKQISFAAGALILAGCYSSESHKPFIVLLGRLIPLGAFLYALPLISFGIAHLRQTEAVATMVPTWIPLPVPLTFIAGLGLIATGIAIISKIKVRLATTLCGAMILSWFIILHIPRIIDSAPAYLGSEVTSAFIALAYSGIAFLIAGAAKQ